MKLIKITLFSLILSGLLPGASYTAALRADDVVQKSPRVAELEDKLTQDATSYLKGRFPSQPFLVVVSVDPLRRETNVAAKGDGDDLPYTEFQSDEIRDEWDDPQIGLTQLINRVKKASVTVSLPTSVTDDEIHEIKTSLISYLHLVPARDDVQIERRSWSITPPNWLSISIGFLFAFFVLGGLFFIQRGSTKKLAQALASNKSSQASSAMSAGPAPSVSSGSSGGQADRGGNGDMTVSDPMQLRELAIRLIDETVRSEAFPTLEDMVILEELGSEDPKALGAILKLFPTSVQEKLYSLSRLPIWLEAFHRPGSLNMHTLETLQRLSQNIRESSTQSWNRLLICVWRLDQDVTGFLKTIRSEQAFSILNEMPKNVALSAARKAFPGSWGSLLDTQFSPPKPSEKDIKDLTESALRQKPLNSFSGMKKYKAEVELLDYLRFADVAEERDIYGASDPTSIIHRMRKPFYPVLDQGPEIFKELLAFIGLDSWALALFNISKNERQNFESALDEKERYVFKDKMKRFDASAPKKIAVSNAREQIANQLANLQALHENARKEEEEMKAAAQKKSDDEDVQEDATAQAA
jgi:hypothetical protein